MCGRLTIRSDTNELRGFFAKLQREVWQGPRYNVAPTQTVATILNDGTANVHQTTWGLIPHWASDRSIGDKMINARAETLSERPAFKPLLAQRRCIILADGFYEWKAIAGGKLKQPYYITLKSGELFGLAGLWDTWKSSDGQVVTSSTIITTVPNRLMVDVHDRMPVILRPEAIPMWISTETQLTRALKGVLTAYPAELMQMYPVSGLVNKATVDTPECIRPLGADRL